MLTVKHVLESCRGLHDERMIIFGGIWCIWILKSMIRKFLHLDELIDTTSHIDNSRKPGVLTYSILGRSQGNEMS